jgi:hypothetical protein
MPSIAFNTGFVTDLNYERIMHAQCVHIKKKYRFRICLLSFAESIIVYHIKQSFAGAGRVSECPNSMDY